MATVQVAVQLSQETLLQAVNQLSDDELNQFVDQVVAIAEQRKQSEIPDASTSEAELLHRATQTIPPQIQHRLQVLVPKRENEALTAVEQQEFLQLTRQVEALNVERMEAVAKLALKREMSLAAMMESLNIKPIEYV